MRWHARSGEEIMGKRAVGAGAAFTIEKLHMEEQERFPTAPSRGRPGEWCTICRSEASAEVSGKN